MTNLANNWGSETAKAVITTSEFDSIKQLERAFDRCSRSVRIQYLHTFMLMKQVPDLYTTVIYPEVIAFDFDLATTAWMIFMLETDDFDIAMSQFQEKYGHLLEEILYS